jgi:pimeloyl-ACP methyl ester carboxylesterase
METTERPWEEWGTLRSVESNEVSVTTSDGRSLQVWVAGPEDALPLVLHHYTPGSGLPFGPRVRDAVDAGFRYVSYSRPGYGDSARKAERLVADAAADVAAILDHLGAERCCTMGASGGGPHALATGALLLDRVLAVATLASYAPYGQPDLDFLAGMGRESVEEFSLVIEGRKDELVALMLRDVQSTASGKIDQVIEDMSELLPPVDRAVFTSEFGTAFLADVRMAYRNGIWGWFDDAFAFVHPWGFELASISVPVEIWQGDLDKIVPEPHGEWLAGHVPGAHLHSQLGHGHLSLAGRMMPEIMENLASAAGVR